ncbi:MAG: hypothetical protein L6407_02520 [Candidatus Delongbacteria bacterium]|nr:hypothetical protein [Candidatus Delongbacteria bacterium]
MINVIVVPENDNFKIDVSYRNIVGIDKNIGIPNLEQQNAKYLAPYWLSKDFKGVNRIYHIEGFDSKTNEIKLGNSFILKNSWNQMGNHRKFEYHSLESFNFVEVNEGYLILESYNVK